MTGRPIRPARNVELGASGEEFQNLHEFVRKARARLNQNAWDYIVGAAETETTMRRNRMALDEIAFRPRVLRNVARVDASVEAFGRKLRLPVVIAPVGALEIFDPESGAAVARGAGSFGAAHMLSSVSEPGLEETAQAAPDALRMFQLYVRGDDAFVEDIVSRSDRKRLFRVLPDRRHRALQPARARHRQALCPREPHPRHRRRLPEGAGVAHREADQGQVQDPAGLKGIATAEDAAIALDHGVDWIYVSNHGGRQLDHGRGAMHVLPEIVDAVAGRAKIMVDGSFCRGTDIVKAIASGADLVGIGRLQCWALAAAGEAGIVRMLELLEDEVIRCLGLLGVTSLRRTRQILSAGGNADQSAERVQRIPAAGYRTLSILSTALPLVRVWVNAVLGEGAQALIVGSEPSRCAQEAAAMQTKSDRNLPIVEGNGGQSFR